MSTNCMRHFLVLPCIILNFALVYGQLKKITPEVLSKWPVLIDGKLSRDGRFFSCIHTEKEGGFNELLVKSIDGRWYKRLSGTKALSFTSDSRLLLVQRGDSLKQLKLGTREEKFLGRAEDVMVSTTKYGDWVAFRYAYQSVLANIQTGKKLGMGNARNYLFSPAGRYFIYASASSEGFSLTKLDLQNLQPQQIWSSRTEEFEPDFVTCEGDTQLVFMTKGKAGRRIWHYSNGDEHARELLCDSFADFDSSYRIGNENLRFIGNGSHLMFSIQELNDSRISPGYDIWSYLDPVLQSQQLTDVLQMPSLEFRAVINLRTKKLTQLETYNEKVLGSFGMGQSSNTKTFPAQGAIAGNYVLLMNSQGHTEHWNKLHRVSVYITDLLSGDKQLVRANVNDGGARQVGTWFTVTPDEKHVLYFDNEDGQWWSYNIQTSERKNLTASVGVIWRDSYSESVRARRFQPAGLCGWLNKSNALIRDTYGDIWKIDIESVHDPECITRQYGKNQSVFFSLISVNTKNILLSGLLRKEKTEALFSVSAIEDENPVLLTKEFEYIGTLPDKNIHLLRTASPTLFPNYFVTNDFKRFTSLTSLHPEKDYHWYSAEIVHWATLDSQPSRGILYRPQQLEEGRTYPVVITYYETRGDAFGAELFNRNPQGILNVVDYVCNGYLILSAEIRYPENVPSGKAAYNSIVAAAKRMSGFSFVDPNRIGLRGQSFGGFQTNYLIAHTNIFAAAVSTCGVSNVISEYFDIRDDNDEEATLQSNVELGQLRMGIPIWDSIQLYIQESPVLSARNITTPLLMVSNREDNRVHFRQGYELFTTLRRLGKKAWMIQYDGAVHGTGMGFYLRERQFFDHYLKDSLPPKWMTRGIPARSKGKIDGLEIDREIVSPPPSPLIDAQEIAD